MSERMNASSDLSELEWIEIRSAVKQPDQQLGFWDKFKGKAIENPFIPLGLLVTTCFLGLGLHSMYTGQRQRSQYMMRGRVLAQAFTVIAMVGGMALGASRKSPSPKQS